MKSLLQSDNRSIGFLNKARTHFIDVEGVEWGIVDRILNPKAYNAALVLLHDELNARAKNEALCNEDQSSSVIADDLPSDEELEMMSGRNRPTIKHIGVPRFIINEIHENGGLIPIKSDRAFQIKPRQSYHIQSGFIINIPVGYMGVLYARKGMNQRGIDVKGQVIHHMHDKEFTIYLKNTDLNEVAEVGIGEEVAQLAVVPIRTDFKII